MRPSADRINAIAKTEAIMSWISLALFMDFTPLM